MEFFYKIFKYFKLIKLKQDSNIVKIIYCYITQTKNEIMMSEVNYGTRVKWG